jgi:diamine N-acetyltransferase
MTVPTIEPTSEVRLEPVTEDNWRSCAALAVRPDQADYVAAVTYYLCLCAYGSSWQPLAIVRGDVVVGFCMWAVDDDGSRWVGGLVVDAAVQRTGVARAALTALIERFEAQPGCTGVGLSYSPENIEARRLYAALGFVETGETEDDGAEVVARRPLTSAR